MAGKIGPTGRHGKTAAPFPLGRTRSKMAGTAHGRFCGSVGELEEPRRQDSSVQSQFSPSATVFWGSTRAKQALLHLQALAPSTCW